MLKEFIEALADQAVRAASTRFVDLSKYGEEPGHYGVVKPDGKWDIKVAADPRRKCLALSLKTITDHAAEEEGCPGEIWYGRYGVWWVGRSTDVTKISTAHVRMPLTFTPQFREVMRWDADPSPYGPQFTQQRLAHMLRTTFANSVETPSLPTALRLLRWSRGEQAEAAVQVGKSSIGRQTRGEVTGEAALPEVFTLKLRVFAEVPFAHDVEIALEPITDKEELAVRPLAGSVEDAIGLTENDLLAGLEDLLAGARVNLYHGDPRGN